MGGRIIPRQRRTARLRLDLGAGGCGEGGGRPMPGLETAVEYGREGALGDAKWGIE